QTRLEPERTRTSPPMPRGKCSAFRCEGWSSCGNLPCDDWWGMRWARECAALPIMIVKFLGNSTYRLTTSRQQTSMGGTCEERRCMSTVFITAFEPYDQWQ